MKNICLYFLTAGMLLLTGCLENTQEITLNKDGSGTISTISDMSTLLGLAKNMGAGAEMDKLAGQKMDTVISLTNLVDSIENLTDNEKQVLKKGTMGVTMDISQEKFSTKLSFPFSALSEITSITKLTGKVSAQSMKEQMANMPGSDQGMNLGMNNMPEPSSFDDYFDMKFTDDKIERSINKEKYAKASADEYLNGIKQASAMGIPVTSTLILNLPRPAEKVEGTNVKLSDDKMKVTVKADINDFFDHPEKLEFKVKF